MGHVIPLSEEAKARLRPAGKISFEEYLKLYDGTHAEWVDGEVEMGSPVSNEHQDDARFLTMLLGFYVEARDLGVIRAGPFPMRLDTQSLGREPDLFFIRKENLHRLTRGYFDGPADIAIEIISPESLARDRGTKFAEYEEGGVREYWLIDPERKQAEFYELGDDHRYHPILIGAQGMFRSKVLDGFYLNIEWLWQEPRPKVMNILREMGIL